MKNNSFKQTFYLGLVLVISITSILMLLGYNLFIAVTPKFKKDKVETYVDEPQTEKEIVHDTVYLDRPRVKINDTPKNVTIVKSRTTPVISEKTDTTILVDTVK